MTHRGAQATGLGVIISRCSPGGQHGKPSRHPANVGCSFFRYTKDDLRNHANQRCKHKTGTREDNHFALHCNFRSNSSQRGYRKSMIEIWQESSSFQKTSQRLADQVRTILKKDWFSDLEILEIRQKMNNEQDNNTISDTPSFDK